MLMFLCLKNLKEKRAIPLLKTLFERQKEKTYYITNLILQTNGIYFSPS